MPDYDDDFRKTFQDEGVKRGAQVVDAMSKAWDFFTREVEDAKGQAYCPNEHFWEATLSADGEDFTPDICPECGKDAEGIEIEE